LIVLRWCIPAFLASPLIGWLCVTSTVVGALGLELRLARVAWGEAVPNAERDAALVAALP
jgi:hypothetical protein